MGAWGEKPFQNDAALDWLAELEAAGVSALRDVLSSGADERSAGEYLDVDDGSRVIAAAEVVAAALGRGRERLTSRVSAWLDQNAAAIGTDDLLVARSAVVRVLCGEESELRALWEEHGDETAWHADVRELLARLGGDADAIPRARGSGSEGSGDAQLLQALLTFMHMRGLVPTAAQLERIHAESSGATLHRWLARVVDAPSVQALLDG